MIRKALLTIALLVPVAAALATGDPAAGKAKSGVCAGCHGSDGNSVNPLWPKLAGQGERYLRQELRQLQSGERKDPTMSPMAAGLSDQDRADLAAYFSSQKRANGVAKSQELAETGQRLYRGGNSDKGIPACSSCHGPGGQGNAEGGFPALGGQHAAYTSKALNDFRSGARTDDYAAMMQDIARRMNDQEIEAVSEYIAGLH